MVKILVDAYKARLKQVSDRMNEILGVKLGEKTAEKLYTVATQLFHRLWWENSKNLGLRYRVSRRGKTPEDLIRHYHQLNRFPACVKYLEKELRNKGLLAIASLEHGSKHNVHVLLKPMFPIDTSGIRSVIAQHKKNRKNRRNWRKHLLKIHSIENILIPLVWRHIVAELGKSA